MDEAQLLQNRRHQDERVEGCLAHEGPCLAVTLNDRQDYFGQTVNIASRVQNLAVSRAIFATESVVDNPQSSKLLKSAGLKALPQRAALDGISARVAVYEIP